MGSERYDVAIIGGGIIGMATAMALTSRHALSLVVLEAEDHLAAHQSGHNSGVIHSGLYYAPGSMKARNCVEGREAMYRFCLENGIPHDRCGKVVVATSEREMPALEELARRGKANGLQGLRPLKPDDIREYEPHASGLAGLFVPETGIVDYAQVTDAFAAKTRAAGGQIQLNARIQRCHRRPNELVLEWASGETHCRTLINCGGLQCDRIARMSGIDPGIQVIPFRGEYYELVPERRFLVKNLIYPVPDPRFPFLGVHFTRTIHGGIEAGPNAVLALEREGYSRASFSFADSLPLLFSAGFWRMARRYWMTGLGEIYRSASKRAFVKALRRLVPELRVDDIKRAGAGVRAQSLDRSGALVDDFRIVEAENMIHVLNAPSPAATASISIGSTIAGMAAKRFEFPARSSTTISAFQ